MTQHEMFQVDAFAERLFTGNPAAVLILDRFLPDGTMQAIAQENNLAETAFAVPRPGGRYDLRWFTPGAEVPFCGHATLATAHVLLSELGIGGDAVTFDTRRVGPLTVTRGQGGDGLTLDGPAGQLTRIEPPEGLADALGAAPREVHAGQYLMAVLDDEAAVRGLDPDLFALGKVRSPLADASVDGHCVCVTARGEETDFVSRFFGPTVGITEDPVTGSAHCMMAPYWAARLGKTTLSAYQASPRGGHVACVMDGDRVRLTGRAVTFLRGTIRLP